MDTELKHAVNKRDTGNFNVKKELKGLYRIDFTEKYVNLHYKPY